MDGVTQRVLHYKTQLETSKESKKIDHVFNRLEDLPITVNVLQSTGIGKVVNGFRKHEGSIGRKAKVIVSRWKAMVAEEAMRLDAEREASDSGNNVSDNDVSSVDSQHSVHSNDMSSKDSSDVDEERSDLERPSSKEREPYKSISKSDKHRDYNKKHKEIRDKKSDKTSVTCNGLNSESYGERNHTDKKRSSSKTDTSHRESGSKRDKSDNRSSSQRDHSNSQSSKDRDLTSHKTHKSSHSHYSHSSPDEEPVRREKLNDSKVSQHRSHKESTQSASVKHRDKHDVHEDTKREKDRHIEKEKHREKEKHKEVDKHREKDKHREVDKHTEKVKHKDKDKHSKEDKHNGKEYKSNEKEKDKNRDTEKDKRGENEKHRKIEKDKHREKDKHKPNYKYSEKGKHEEKEKQHMGIDSANQKVSNRLVYHDDIVEADSRLSPLTTGNTFVENEESPGHLFFDRHTSPSQMDYADLSPDHTASPQYSGLSPESAQNDDSMDELPDLSSLSKSDINHLLSKYGDKEKGHSAGHRSGQGHSSKDSKSHGSSLSSTHSSKHSSGHSKSSKHSSSSKDSSGKSSKYSSSSKDTSGKDTSSKDTSSKSSKHSSSSSKSSSTSSHSEAKKHSDHQSKSHSADKGSHKSDGKHGEKSHSEHSKTSSKDSKSSKEKKRKSDHHSKEESSSKKYRRSSQQELGLSFADCLDLDSSTKKGKSTSDYEKLKSKFKIKKKGTVGDISAREKSSPTPNLPSAKRKTEEGNSIVPSPTKQVKLSSRDISTSLPEISTTYRPWRANLLEEKKKMVETASDFDESLIGTKNYTRTQVYSGKKQVTVPELYSLQEICLQVLCNNIDNLENVGAAPYYILKPVLERCTAMQLYRIEDYNPQFVVDTDELWKLHCHKDFKGAQPDEFESWRELYIRKYDEREAKLKSVRTNITASIAKSQPVRTAKLAYVDSAAKPPREVRRQQLKYGTAGPTTGERMKRIDKFATAMDPIAINREKREEKNVKQKAPMMQKTLKMIRNIRR